MILIGKHRIKNHMTMNFDFTGIRILGACLEPVDWHITVDLAATEKKGQTPEDIESTATLTYQRIYFWLDTNLPSTVMVDVSNAADLYIANLSSNLMMYCPQAPYDDVIAQLLHSKISVLAGDSLIVGALQIKASDVTVGYTFDPSDSGYGLPLTTKEYYKEGTARDALPWWTRPDGFSFEFIRPDDASITDEELFSGIIDPMTEFEKAMAESTEKNIGNTEPARIVQVEKWKPKKVK